MKSISIAVAATSIACASAFTKPPAPQTARLGTELNEYIPSGFTKESWAKFKTKEAKTKASQKNLGRMGPKGFQSRSFQSFQEALERGETSHLMPVMNAKERVRKGELKVEDIPYMQRGGNWDNSDVKGAKKIGWLKSDKEYADGVSCRPSSRYFSMGLYVISMYVPLVYISSSLFRSLHHR